MNKAYMLNLLFELLKAAVLSMLTLLVREVARFLRGNDGCAEEAWM